MKIGISFDTCKEANDVIHYSFIAALWLNTSTFASFNLTTQIHMSQIGYDVKKIDKFYPLIKKAKSWSMNNVSPINTIFTKADLMEWVELYEICKEIYYFEMNMRISHLKQCN